MIEAMQNFALSDKFGWTPEQIANMDVGRKMEYISIMNGLGEAKVE